MIEVEPLGGAFGGVVRGAQPREVDSSTFDAIPEAWIEAGLLVVPDQHLAPAEQDTFVRRLGDLELTATPLTNLRRHGTLRTDPDDHFLRSLCGDEGWHHDSTYLPLQVKGAVFGAETVPRCGGATGFTDMRAADEALDDDTRDRVGALAARHSRRYSMEGPVITSRTTSLIRSTATTATSRRSARSSRSTPTRADRTADRPARRRGRRTPGRRVGGPARPSDRRGVCRPEHLPPRVDGRRRPGPGQPSAHASGDAA